MINIYAVILLITIQGTLGSESQKFTLEAKLQIFRERNNSMILKNFCWNKSELSNSTYIPNNLSTQLGKHISTNDYLWGAKATANPLEYLGDGYIYTVYNVDRNGIFPVSSASLFTDPQHKILLNAITCVQDKNNYILAYKKASNFEQKIKNFIIKDLGSIIELLLKVLEKYITLNKHNVKHNNISPRTLFFEEANPQEPLIGQLMYAYVGEEESTVNSAYTLGHPRLYDSRKPSTEYYGVAKLIILLSAFLILEETPQHLQNNFSFYLNQINDVYCNSKELENAIPQNKIAYSSDIQNIFKAMCSYRIFDKNVAENAYIDMKNALSTIKKNLTIPGLYGLHNKITWEFKTLSTQYS